jgi:hypothetical protein
MPTEFLPPPPPDFQTFLHPWNLKQTNTRKKESIFALAKYIIEMAKPSK